ncbi:MAG: PAS domain S-box protein [Deltaproteobacteria bacterium]|nr:PAS domain S-box protein [Deltaproteobacteria bacterium]TLN02033.1 MAG: PAS domain S-box protein [bacterium]
MTGTDEHSKQAAELRERAEQIFREKAAAPQESLEALLPDEARRTLHELRVHQIELEMQNEELRRAQAELDAARERYFDLYDLAPVAYCTISEHGLLLESNLAAATLFGLARSALVKKPISRYILKEDQDIFYLHRKQLFENGEPQAFELRMVKVDGTEFWAHLVATAGQDDAGAPVCRVVISDITEHKFQEDERELTARLIVLVSTSGDFHECISAMIDALHGWSGCDAVAIRLRAGDDYPYYETRGFPPEFVHDENHLCAYSPDGKILRDDAGKADLKCMCGNILRGRFDPAKPFFTAYGSFWSNNSTALLAGTTAADRQARTPNRCNGEGYESVALIPLHIDQQVFGLLQFNDRRPNRFTPVQITHFERMADSLTIALAGRQAEEERLESERRLREAQKMAQLGHWIWDVKTGNVDWSGEVFGIFGLDPKDFTPHKDSILALSPWPEDHERDKELIRKAMQSREQGTYEQRFLRPDNSIGYYHSTFQGKYDDRGNLISIVGTVQDITERKQAEEEKAKLEDQLQQAQKMEAIGQLAGGVAHDFNNNLQVITTYVEMALMDLNTDHRLFSPLTEIRKAAERSANLTRQLLAFARKQTVEPKVLDLNETVQGMLKMLQRLIGEDIDLRWQPGVDLPPLNIDPSQIDQILANLCVNARDAISDVGVITIETGNRTFDEEYCTANDGFVPGEYLRLTVIDSGCGMDKEMLGHIFEPFFTTKGVGEGTGLGLATVYGIVKQNNGFLKVYSEPGRGSTFSIFLPCHVCKVCQPRQESLSMSDMRGYETILLVEDDLSIMEISAVALKSFGYSVLAANTPGDALRLAEEHAGNIHLLVTDVVMPKMNGRDLAKIMLSLYPDIKRLFMSGYTADVITQRGILEEGVHFIQKPFSIQKLAAKVREVLAKE